MGPPRAADRLLWEHHRRSTSISTYCTGHLTELLFSSGNVDEVTATWTDVLLDGAPDLVSEATVAGDAEAIITYVDVMR